MTRNIPRCRLLLPILAFGLAVDVGVVPASPETELRERTQAALEAFRTAHRSPASRDSVRSELLEVSEMLSTAGLDSLTAVCLDCAGILTFRAGGLDEAQEIWTRALALARSTGDPGLTVRCLNSRAVGYGASGDYERAITMLAEQLPIREALGDAHGLGTVWGNLTGAYEALGRIPESIEAGEQALRYHLVSGEPRGLSATYGTLAQLLASVDNLPQAAVWADSSVAIARRNDFPQALGLSLTNRATVQFAAGLHEEALASLDESVAIHAANEDAYYATWPRVDRGASLIRLGRSVEFLDTIEDVRAHVESYDNPVLVNRLNRLEGIALIEAGRLAEAESLLANAIAHLDTAHAERTGHERVPGVHQGSGGLSMALARCLLAQGNVEAAWAAAEAGRARRFRARGEAKPPEAVTLEELQEILGATNAAILEFTDLDVVPAPVFGITADGITAGECDLGPDLRDRIRTALDLLSSGADDRTCATALRRLGAALAPDLLAGMPDFVERLYVIPPAPLAGFPLEVLPVDSPDGRERTLGERWSVAYLPGATALRTLSHRDPAIRGILALADPSAGEPTDDGGLGPISRLRRLRETPLPYAREEVRAIAPRGAAVFVGDAATREAATGDVARRAAVIHFATHADVNPIHGDRSSLLLAGANGLLTAGEIESLGLRADLVTLSGCRTSGGFTVLGEGTVGLARAFLLAGARSVVASAWDVEDRAASRFMTLFYEQLSEGGSRDEALRATRQGMEDEGFPPRDRYAFVISGLGHAPVESLVGGREMPWTGRVVLAIVAAGILLGGWRLRRRLTGGSPTA